MGLGPGPTPPSPPQGPYAPWPQPSYPPQPPAPGQYVPPQSPPFPQFEAPYPQQQYAQPYPQPQFGAPPQPGKPKNTGKAIFFTALAIGIAVALVLVGLFVYRHFISPPAAPPPAPQTSASTPPATSATPTATPQPPVGTYGREREDLNAAELELYGNLHKGDCLTNPPSDLTQPFTTVDCSQPHTNQVMGFVDLSEGMPDMGNATYEFAVAQRCNALKATLPIPPDFDQGVAAIYPDSSDWDNGVRAALCWVPIFHTTWVGSAIDGTAVKV